MKRRAEARQMSKPVFVMNAFASNAPSRGCFATWINWPDIFRCLERYWNVAQTRSNPSFQPFSTNCCKGRASLHHHRAITRHVGSACLVHMVCAVGCGFMSPGDLGWKGHYEWKRRGVARSLWWMDRCDKGHLSAANLSTGNWSCCSSQQQLCTAGEWYGQDDDGRGLQIDSSLLLWNSPSDQDHHPVWSHRSKGETWTGESQRRRGGNRWSRPKGHMATRDIGDMAEKRQLTRLTQPLFRAQDPQSPRGFYESLRRGIHRFPEWSWQYVHAQILSIGKSNCGKNESLRTWKFHLHHPSVADATLPRMSLRRRSQWLLLGQESQHVWATLEMSIRRGGEELLISCKVRRNCVECRAFQHPTWKSLAWATARGFWPHSSYGSALWAAFDSHHEYPRRHLRHQSRAATPRQVQHHWPHHWIQWSRLPSTGHGWTQVPGCSRANLRGIGVPHSMHVESSKTDQSTHTYLILFEMCSWSSFFDFLWPFVCTEMEDLVAWAKALI